MFICSRKKTREPSKHVYSLITDTVSSEYAPKWITRHTETTKSRYSSWSMEKSNQRKRKLLKEHYIRSNTQITSSESARKVSMFCTGTKSVCNMLNPGYISAPSRPVLITTILLSRLVLVIGSRSIWRLRYNPCRSTENSKIKFSATVLQFSLLCNSQKDRIGLFNIKMQCFLDFNDTKDGIPEIDTLLSGKEIAKRKYKLPIYVKENENYERRYAHLS